MTSLQVCNMLGICAIINAVLGISTFFIVSKKREAIYRIHSRFFPISESQFNVIIYSVFSFYKVLVFIFNIVPWIALTIMLW